MKIGKLIHVGSLSEKGNGTFYIFLRQVSPHEFVWFKETKEGDETPIGIEAPTLEEALRLAQRNLEGLRTIGCGFRYSLPERDEHGTNALFFQMAASYSTPTGVYFDEDLGHNCIVNAASLEARQLLKKLEGQNRL